MLHLMLLNLMVFPLNLLFYYTFMLDYILTSSTIALNENGSLIARFANILRSNYIFE